MRLGPMRRAIRPLDGQQLGRCGHSSDIADGFDNALWKINWRGCLEHVCSGEYS